MNCRTCRRTDGWACPTPMTRSFSSKFGMGSSSPRSDRNVTPNSYPGPKNRSAKYVQWAAVRKTRSLTIVPLHHGIRLPSASLMTTLPTFGCLFPSGCPKVIACAGVVATSATTALTTSSRRIVFPLSLVKGRARLLPSSAVRGFESSECVRMRSPAPHGPSILVQSTDDHREEPRPAATAFRPKRQRARCTMPNQIVEPSV